MRSGNAMNSRTTFHRAKKDYPDGGVHSRPNRVTAMGG